MKAHDIMTPNPACCVPSDTAQEAARLMREHDCGCLPVVDPVSRRVLGIITDRDLAIRAVAEGKGTGTRLGDLMTVVANCCGENDDLRDVERTMASNQVRRVPIVDSDGQCVGIVAQADIALAGRRHPTVTDREVALVVERISEPSPSRLSRNKDAGDDRSWLADADSTGTTRSKDPDSSDHERGLREE